MTGTIVKSIAIGLAFLYSITGFAIEKTPFTSEEKILIRKLIKDDVDGSKIGYDTGILYGLNIDKIDGEDELFVDSRKIVRQFDKNELKGNRLYKGKVIAVKGLIENVGLDIMNNPYVALSGGGGIRSFQGFIDKKDEVSMLFAENLIKGQEITLVCKVKGLFGNVLGEKCYLLVPRVEAIGEAMMAAVDSYGVKKLPRKEAKLLNSKIALSFVIAKQVFQRMNKDERNSCMGEDFSETCKNAFSEKTQEVIDTKEKAEQLFKEAENFVNSL